jgi:hypothetical protein
MRVYASHGTAGDDPPYLLQYSCSTKFSTIDCNYQYMYILEYSNVLSILNLVVIKLRTYEGLTLIKIWSR